MFSAKFVLSAYSVLLIIGFYGNGDALECYVCRGESCTDPTEEHIQTCPASKPDETDPETDPEETNPEETNPEETNPEETNPEETNPEETNPEETNPEETNPEETNPEETNPEETNPEETDPETDPGTNPEETNPETDPEGTNPEETNPESNPDKDITVVNIPARVRLVRSLNNIRNEEEQATSDARCIVTSFIENGTTVFARGCGFASNTTEEDECKNIAAGTDDNFNATLETCRVCNENRCNSATKSMATTVLLFIAAFVNVRLFV